MNDVKGKGTVPELRTNNPPIPPLVKGGEGGLDSGQSPEEAIVIFITASSKEKAGKIAKILVEEHLAACVNIVERVRSIYRWKGEICDEAESLIVIKTKRGLFDKLSTKVKEVHSYTVPEIIALPIIKGSEEYIKWLREETS